MTARYRPSASPTVPSGVPPCSRSDRFKQVASATAVIRKMLLVAETKFRKLNAPELLQEVCEGAEYRDGV